MSSRRTAKINRAIQETVSTTVLFHLKDPRVKNVTVLGAEVSDDIRSAKVYVSVMGDEKVQALTMRGLRAARGFLQSKVADRLQTKNTPILQFVLDPGIKRSIETSVLLREALGSGAPEAEPAAELPSDEVEAPEDEAVSESETDGVTDDDESGEPHSS